MILKVVYKLMIVVFAFLAAATTAMTIKSVQNSTEERIESTVSPSYVSDKSNEIMATSQENNYESEELVEMISSRIRDKTCQISAVKCRNDVDFVSKYVIIIEQLFNDVESLFRANYLRCKNQTQLNGRSIEEKKISKIKG